MTTRDIRTTRPHLSCDVCGRTLLRGERAQTFLAGGARHEVCELCATRATHEGWVREGGALDVETRPAAGDRRRSLRGRWRDLRDTARVRAEERSDAAAVERELSAEEEPADEPAPRPRPERASMAASGPSTGQPRQPRHPRHVRAVPTSPEQKTLVALESFNASDHPRTVAGIARSLGAPDVCARPCSDRPRAVTIVVAWELCWYRYDVDLSDGGTSVHAAGQGYELGELSSEDREVNATADDRGRLDLLEA